MHQDGQCTTKVVKFKAYLEKLDENGPTILIDYLAQNTQLSKSQIKRALSEGAVWIAAQAGRFKKVKRAQTELQRGQFVQVFWDPEMKAKLAPLLQQVHEIYPQKNWGIWFKPAGLLSQGSKWGDAFTVESVVKQSKGQAFTINRLDMETSGLNIFAYNSQVARELSLDLQNNQIEKHYLALVSGQMKMARGPADWIKIETPIDNRPAISFYRVLKVFENNNTTLLEVKLGTGRTHQIRRHLDFAGFPIMGDPKYGQGNKNSDGLKLEAYRLIIPGIKPGEKITIELPDHLSLLKKTLKKAS